jgi:hypothetical protein
MFLGRVLCFCPGSASNHIPTYLLTLQPPA